jgi:hypothetical protein
VHALIDHLSLLYIHDACKQLAGEIINAVLLIDHQLDKVLEVSENNRTELERMIEQVGKQHQQICDMVERRRVVEADHRHSLSLHPHLTSKQRVISCLSIRISCFVHVIIRKLSRESSADSVVVFIGCCLHGSLEHHLCIQSIIRVHG